MKKFNELSLTTRAIIIYVGSLILSLLFYFPFGNIYKILFNMVRFGGNLFVPATSTIDFMLSGIITGYIFLVSFLSFFLFNKKAYFVCFIGSIFFWLIFLFGGGMVFFIKIFLLSFLGWLLAQIVLFIKQKLKKANY